MSKKSLKSVSLTEVQDAFAKALSELLGRECTVSLDEVQFETEGAKTYFGGERVKIHGSLDLEPDYSSLHFNDS